MVAKPRSSTKRRTESRGMNSPRGKTNLSYAEILKKVKADPVRAGSRKNIIKIRRKGDLMFQLKKPSLDKMGECHSTGPRIWDAFDKATLRGKISSVLKQLFKLQELGEDSILSLRKTYDGTKMGTMQRRKCCRSKKLESNWLSAV